jgi:hypothetical protein
MNRTLAIAAFLMAAALTGIFSTSAYAQGDESETKYRTVNSTKERWKR